MRVPIRKSEQSRKYHDEGGAIPLTAAGIQRLKDTLRRLEKYDLPQAIADTARTAELGDFSENAEYQEAKARMRRTHARIFSLKDRLTRAVAINSDARMAGKVQLGSTVVLAVGRARKTYEIVGPQETDPSRGRISHRSPLGVALIGRKAGEAVTLHAEKGDSMYRIIRVTYNAFM